MKRLQPLLIALLILAWPARLPAEPYQAQSPGASLGGFKIELEGPPSFVRIDGLDRNLDDILLATQAPSAAVLALYAEPGAWKSFQGAKPEAGLHCHALISTPAPLADQVLAPADFSRIKKDLGKNLKASVNKERRLEGELAGVSDHKVKEARGLLESFTVLEEGPDFLTYRLVSSLELNYQESASPRVSRSTTISSTILLGGKIINLQLAAAPEGPGPDQLAATAGAWRKSFIGRNTPDQ